MAPLLVDSGADDSFIDETLARHAGLPLVELEEPHVVQDLDGRTSARSSHRTALLTLLVSAPLPASRLFNLSRPEREAMETYISESLASGLIYPSSSPVGVGFFFVKKKDSSLRPCK